MEKPQKCRKIRKLTSPKLLVNTQLVNSKYRKKRGRGVLSSNYFLQQKMDNELRRSGHNFLESKDRQEVQVRMGRNLRSGTPSPQLNKRKRPPAATIP